MSLSLKVKTMSYTIGLLIVVLYLLLVVGSVSSHIFWPCDLDCGDRGRSIFALLLLTSPSMPIGLYLLTVGQHKKKSTVSKFVLMFVKKLSLIFAILLVLFGLMFLLSGLGKIYSSLTGIGITGPINDLTYARQMARNAGLGFTVIGLMVIVIGLSAAWTWRRLTRD